MNSKLRCLAALLLVPLLLSGCTIPFLRDLYSAPLPAPSSPAPSQKTPVAAVAAVPSPAPAPASSPGSSSPGRVLPLREESPPAPQAPVVRPTAPEPPPPVPQEPRKRLAPAQAPDRITTGGILTEDVTWRGLVLVEGDVTVAPQATLFIEPGTIIRFRGSENRNGIALLVQGRLAAEGSAGNPITFTSDFADIRGGDWQGIVLLASEKNNILQHCLIEGAETGVEALFSKVELKETGFASCRTGAAFRDSLVTVSGGQVRSCTIGMDIDDSEADLDGTGFVANGSALTAAGGSLSVERSSFLRNEREALSAGNSRVRIRGSIFSLNGSGLTLTGCEGGIAGNQVTKNVGHGIRLVRSRIKVSGNEIASNGGFGLEAGDGRCVAWGNILTDNGGYDLYNAGSREITAIGNWWGKSDTEIPGRIYGRHLDSAAGPVRYAPVLRAMPSLVRR